MDFLFPLAYRFLPTVMVHTGQASGNRLVCPVCTVSASVFLLSFFFAFSWSSIITCANRYENLLVASKKINKKRTKSVWISYFRLPTDSCPLWWYTLGMQAEVDLYAQCAPFSPLFFFFILFFAFSGSSIISCANRYENLLLASKKKIKNEQKVHGFPTSACLPIPAHCGGTHWACRRK